MSLFLQLVVYGVVAGSVIAVSGVSFSLVYGTTGHFHVAQSAVVAVAAYSAFVVLEVVPTIWPLAFVAAILVAAVVGVGIHILVYEPLETRGVSPLALFIASLGTMVVIQNVLALFFGVQPRLRTVEVLSHRHELTPSLGVTNNQLLTVALAFATWAFVRTYLKRTSSGREIVATADNPRTAAIVGIDVKRVYRRTYVVASALLGSAGALTVLASGAEPYGGTTLFILAATTAFVGGRGNVTGAFVAALVFGMIQSITVMRLAAEWQTTAALVAFLLLLAVKPGGLKTADRAAGV